MIDIINGFEVVSEKRVLITGSLIARGTKLDNEVWIEKKIGYSKKSILSRFITWAIFYFQTLFLIWMRYPRAHIFFVTNPPLNIFIPGLIRNKYSFLLYDLYPEVLVRNKWIKPDSIIERTWNRVNSKVFKGAEHVFTISPKMQKTLNTKYPLARISYVPLWAGSNDFEPVDPLENEFIKDLGLAGKFLVVYSGNLGFTHDVDVLVDVAVHVRNPDIHFLIIGDGAKKDLIKNKLNDFRLKNCSLLPFQPFNMLKYTVGGADIGVVTLASGAEGLSIPSKTFTLLAAGKPILCISSRDSELAELIGRYNFGKNFTSKEILEMASFLDEISSQKERMEFFRINAQNAAKNFTKGNVEKFLQGYKN